jgi:hypothetical protein
LFGCEEDCLPTVLKLLSCEYFLNVLTTNSQEMANNADVRLDAQDNGEVCDRRRHDSSAMETVTARPCEGDYKLSEPKIPIKSRRMRWAGHAERMGEKRNAYRILVGKPEGKRPLGRSRRRWVDNIKMDLR